MEARGATRQAAWTPELRQRVETIRARLMELNQRGEGGEEWPDGCIARRVAGQWVTPQLDLFTDLGYTPFSRTWPRSGSMRRGIICPLPPSAPRTAAIAPSSPLLPTPMARTKGGTEVSSESREGGPMLREALLLLLPSPAMNDGQRYRIRTASEGFNKPLEQRLVELGSTGDSSSPRSDGGKGLSDELRLNPSFVEWMMGAPDGWSDPDCPLSATEFSSRQAGSPDDESSNTRHQDVPGGDDDGAQ